jgi:hypothetical protein
VGTNRSVSALGITNSTILTVSNQQNSNNVQANNANQSGQEHHEWNPPSFKRSENPLLHTLYRPVKENTTETVANRIVFCFFYKRGNRFPAKIGTTIHAERGKKANIEQLGRKRENFIRKNQR